MASPSVIWNGVARTIIDARGLDASDTAHVLAMIYLAASDAAVTSWAASTRSISGARNTRFAVVLWMATRRPSAIQAGRRSFRRRPIPTIYRGTPPTVAAMATMLELFFGDNPGRPIVATSPTNPSFRRQWRTFSEGVTEVIDARIYSGLHYRTSDEAGAQVGRRVARFVFEHAMR